MGVSVVYELVDIRAVVSHHLTYIQLRCKHGKVKAKAPDVAVCPFQHLLAGGIADSERHVGGFLGKGRYEAAMPTVVADL